MTEHFARTRLDRVNALVARHYWTLFVSALLLAGCAPDLRTIDNTAAASVTYEIGPGWVHRERDLRVGATRFSGIEEYGTGEALVASTLVPGTRDIDQALTEAMTGGLGAPFSPDLVATLYGDEAEPSGGILRDAFAGTTRGRGATVSVFVPDGRSPVIELRGFPAHDATGADAVAIVVLAGTLPDGTWRALLDSIRVTR